MSAPLTILADDLTGAADCAVQATRAGLRAVVVFGPPGAAPVTAADAVAYDLDVRNADPATAAARTRAAVPADETYLKIDSTLRGPVAAMVDAALDVHPAGLAVVAPAFPALGRTTAAGRQRTADGGLDVDLPALFAATGRSVATLSVDALRGGAGAAVAPTGILVCDAETDADLDAVAAGLAGARPVWVGSAGLAGALARRRPGPGAAAPATAATVVLTVAGSFAAETVAQVEHLVATPGVRAVGVDPEALAGPGPDAEVARAVAAVRAGLAAGEDPVLRVDTDTEARASLRGAGSEPVRARSLRIASALGRIVAAAALPDGAGLVLTGGETARAVCDALGVAGLALAGEVAPGVPYGSALHRDLRLVTKAGAFGDPDILHRAVRKLKASA